MSPSEQAAHENFLANFPELALAIRELVELGQGRDQIMLHLKLPYVDEALWNAAGQEIDYLVDCGRAGKAMTADMGGYAWST